MISLLCPTRKRPQNVERLVLSVVKTANPHTEICFYVDDDDHTNVFLEKWEKKIVGPRITFSDTWTELLKIATGDILMLCADDIVFQTTGWDAMVEQAFAEVPDRILLVHGDDLGPSGKTFATLPFVSREWVEAVGYFTPRGFSCDWCDTWLHDVAKMIGRYKFLPFVVEHMHRIYGKAPNDETYKETQLRDSRDNNTAKYKARLAEREADAEKLRKVISEFSANRS